MAKKKNRKKHSFKPRQADLVATTEQTSSTTGDISTSVVTKPTHKSSQTQGIDLSYVSSDMKKTAILVAIFLVLELVLWYLFRTTSLGTKAYSLIKL